MDSLSYLAALAALREAEAALVGARGVVLSGRPGPDWSGPARWMVDVRIAELDRDLSRAVSMSAALEDDARRELREALAREAWLQG